MDLNNNDELIIFFNTLLQNKTVNKKAHKLIKFFIITRNYGLINLQNNIEEIFLGKDLEYLITKVIMDGFKKDNISYTSENILKLIVTNYYENGFYYYIFPYQNNNQIKNQGIKAESDTITKLFHKYQLEKYINKIDTIIITDYLEPNLNSNISLDEIKNIMKKNKLYQESDYVIIKDYLNRKIITNNIGIALINKDDGIEYFGDYINLSKINDLLKFINSCNMSDKDIVYFLTNTLSHNEISSLKTIPKEIIRTIGYEIDTKHK